MRSDLYSLDVVRRGLIFMVFGRAASAVLAVAAMLLTARGLSLVEYGVYSTLLAILALSLTYSGLGLDWVSSRFMPEYRVGAPTAEIRRFIGWFVTVRFASLCLVAVVLLVAMGPLSDAFNIGQWTDAVTLYLLVIVLEGQVRSMRSDIFDPLLLQDHTQGSATLRSLLFLALVAAQMPGGLTLHEVVSSDLAASGASVLVAFIQLGVILRRHLAGQEAKPDWRAPRLREIFSVAGHNYTGQLVASLANANTLLLVGASILGPAAVAGFGFCRNLTEQIRRYLPAQLLISVVRPKIVAAFSIDGRLTGIVERVQLLFKANLIILMPLVILAATCGDQVLSLLSGGKFADAWTVAVGFAVFLVLQSHRIVLSLVANIIGRAHLITVGSLVGIVSLPLAAGLALMGYGDKGLAAALVLGELAYHVVFV
ncbi:MAG TPA: oligosaccharide flippase family protein, partial [Azospirillaceae bacterium]|nr:oligosaccharide flippase family protein [Azospirillaceae bacterium]